jgi:hypothetical protein
LANNQRSESANLRFYSKVFDILGYITLFATVFGALAMAVGILEVVPYIYGVIGAAVTTLLLLARARLYAGMAELLERSTD